MSKAKVTVVIPRTKKKKKNTIFFVVGGRLYNSIVVCVEYRNCFEGRYPIAVNDLHAGYQWMIDHADELGVNKDKIAIYGQSSGESVFWLSVKNKKQCLYFHKIESFS